MENSICVLHDTFLYRGGAERLILMMGKALQADIASGFFDPESFNLREEGFKGKIIPITTPRFKKKLRQIKLRFSFFFQTGFLKNYSTIIFSGDCISAVRNAPSNAKKIYYCHTPPRYIFDRKDDYLKKVSWIVRPVYLSAIALFKWLYLRDLAKMDIIITNSTNTQKRLKKFTGYDSIVVYPPVDTEHFKSDSQISKEHYLSFSRLAGIKRVDVIVRAFQGLPDKKLVLTYGNNDPDKDVVLELCKNYKNIIPILSPNDADLKLLVQRAIATISIPIDEDFGMISVESQSCGVPVIGVRDGGLLETVLDGMTGKLIDPKADVEELREAIRNLDEKRAREMEAHCKEHATTFSYENFGKTLKKILEESAH